MIFEQITDENRNVINNFIVEQWFTTKMIIRGKEIDMTAVDGLFALEDEKIIGLITYILYDDIMEITSLDSLCENKGIGTALLTKAVDVARKRNCKKIVLITTNDNINAIRFYQKRGFDMVCLYRNALDNSRKLKPEIPLIGENAIPLKHEIEFEMLLINNV